MTTANKKPEIDYRGITRDDPRLWNMSQLAKIMGVHRVYITRMKAAGFTMNGGKSTLKNALLFQESDKWNND